METCAIACKDLKEQKIFFFQFEVHDEITLGLKTIV